MASPSAGATAGIAATAYSVAAALADNAVWHYASQVPPITVPDTITASWVLLIGAGLQACGHGIHWVANRNKATGAHVVMTPVK